MHPENDRLWIWDMQEKLQSDICSRIPNAKIMPARILKDIYLVQKSGLYRFQLKFVEQDLVIFSHTMDMTEFMNINKMNIENQDADFRGRIIIPRVLINLSFAGLSKKELASQSAIARDIKSIFPECRFLVLSHYRGLFPAHNLQIPDNAVDRYFYFFPGKAGKDDIYKKGDFTSRMDEEAGREYESLVRYLLPHMKYDPVSALR